MPTEGEATSRQWVTGLVLASLLASLFSGNFARVGLPVPLDRLFLLAALALMVVGRSHPELSRLRWRTVHTAMLAMLLWTAWSGFTHRTLETSYGAFALVDRMAVPFLLFVLGPVLFATEDDRRRLMRTLVALGLYLGITAILEMSGAAALVLPRYIMDPDVGILFGRARGPLVEAEANGLLLAACFFASALAIVRSRGLWRGLSVASLGLSALGTLLTLTRSVWIGMALGVLALVLLVPELRRRAHLLLAGAVAGFAGLLMLIPGLAPTLIERLTTERSVFDRQNTNAAALRAIAAHPLDGIGWVRFLREGTDWVRQADGYPVTNVDIEVHNVVLSRAAELGLIGAALWVWCIVAGPGMALLRRSPDRDLTDWRLAFLGYACVWGVCIMVSPVPYVLPNNLLWLIAGFLSREHLVRPAGPARPALATSQRSTAAPAGATAQLSAGISASPPDGAAPPGQPAAPAGRPRADGPPPAFH